jgi:hypothetical protein
MLPPVRPLHIHVSQRFSAEVVPVTQDRNDAVPPINPPKTAWTRPGHVSRLPRYFLEVAALAGTFFAMAEMPPTNQVPEKPTVPYTQMALQVLSMAAFITSLRYYRDHKSRALSFAVGRILAERENLRKQGIHLTHVRSDETVGEDDPAKPKGVYRYTQRLVLAFDKGLLSNIVGAPKVWPISDQYVRRMEALMDGASALQADGTLHDPEHQEFRRKVQDAYRDMAMVLATGPLMEAYMFGSERPFSPLCEDPRIKDLARGIADMEKPDKQWAWGERGQFVRNEVQMAKAQAALFIESLDPKKVKRLVRMLETDMTYFKKRSWSGREIRGALRATDWNKPTVSHPAAPGILVNSPDETPHST